MAKYLEAYKEQALEAYIYCMQEWIDAVIQRKPVDDLIPVNVLPEIKYAEMLQKRLEFLKENLLK